MIGILSETVKTVKQARKQDVLVFLLCFFVAITLIFASFFLINEFSTYLVPKGDGTDNQLSTEVIDLAETLRNAAWVLWVGLTIASLIVGFGILNRGQEQKEKGLDHEVYASNLEMLASDSTMLRIAGIRWLQKLIKDDFNAGQIYFEAFMEYVRNPYMNRGEEYNEEYLNKKFPPDKLLPSDIQGAANALSTVAESFHHNEAIKRNLEFPKILWGKTNFSDNFIPDFSDNSEENFGKIRKNNNRNLAVRVMRKGINEAIFNHYKEKIRYCALCVLFSFLWVFFFSLLRLFAIIPIRFLALLAKFLTVSCYQVLATFGLPNTKNNLLQKKLKATLGKIENKKYNSLCFFSSFANKVIIRAENKMKSDTFDLEMGMFPEPCYVSDYTWQKEKNKFYKDIQKDVEKIFKDYLEKSRGKIRKDDVRDLSDKIIEDVFKPNCEKLMNEDEKNINLEITLPSYFWKNKKKNTVNFPSVMLRKNDMQQANLKGANLMKVDLEGVNMQKANLERANMRSAHLISVNLRDAILERVNMEKANLGYDEFAENSIMPNLENVNLKEANMREIYLAGVNLKNANLEKANMSEAHMDGINLENANLQEADMKKAFLKFPYLKNANLERANMSDAFIAGPRLEIANFKEANLYNAGIKFFADNILDGCDFTGVNFEETRFVDTHGYYSVDEHGGASDEPIPPLRKLEGVILEKANLSGADMGIFTELSKKQILSARWGINRKGEGKPPTLPDKLKKDKDIKKWLEKPHYDLSKLSEEEWKEALKNKHVLDIGGRTWQIRFE